MRTVTAEQRTDDWYKARLGVPTASRFSDIISKTKSGASASRAKYKSELVSEILTGVSRDNYTSSAMVWGTENEDTARLEYELLTGRSVDEIGLCLHDSFNAGASPDGLIGDDGTMEIKCPDTSTHINTLKTGNAPKTYYAQIQGQLWITGRKWCDFVSYDPRLPENAQIIVIRVERDDEYIDDLEEEVLEFVREVEQEVSFVRDYKATK